MLTWQVPIDVGEARLWSVDHPSLYTVVATLRQAEGQAEEEEGTEEGGGIIDQASSHDTCHYCVPIPFQGLTAWMIDGG